MYGLENVTIVVWHGTPTVPAAQLLMRVSQRRRAQYVDGISAVHVVQGTFDLPDGPTRDAFVRVLRDSGGKLAVLCVLVKAGGFWASATRSLLTGLRVMSRGSFEIGLHTEVEAAVNYLLPRHLEKTGVPISKEQLSAELTRLFEAS